MQTRREVLLGGGTAILTALAGCNAVPGFGDESSGSPYDWIPATITDVERPTVAVGYLSEMTEVEAIANANLFGEGFPIDAEDIETYVSGGAQFGTGNDRRFLVIEGDFEQQAARSAAEYWFDVTLEADGTYGDFDRFTATDGGIVVGFDGDAAVAGPSELFESVVDARNGDAERLIDANEDFELFVDAAGSVEYLQCDFVDSKDDLPVIQGHAYEFAADESDLTLLAVFEDESAAASTDWSLAEQPELPTLPDGEETVDGRVVTVSGTRETADIFGDSDETYVPSTNFQYDYDTGSGTLEITHTGGDSFDAESVTIVGSRAYGHDGNTWDQYDAEKGPGSVVSAGDEIVLGAGDMGESLGADFEIDLVWESSDGELTARIGSTSGPDA